MLSEKRQRLYVAQTALAQALTEKGCPPPGFDHKTISVAAAVLRDKRLHSAMRAWPALRSALGKDYANEFALYALSQPLPGAPREDVLAFVRFLRKQGKMPRGLGRAEFQARWRARLCDLFRSTVKFSVLR